jgi:hypothetical protein
MKRNPSPLALRSWLVAALLTAFCLLSTAFGQTASATLSGTVQDQNGAVVPGAAVTIENPATGLKRQATTNEQGSFTVPLLPPGKYTVRAQHDGFTTAEIRDVVLNLGDQKAFQVQLKTGNINETVNVTNEAPLINESPAVGAVVDRQFVENMPLNGRSFQSLLTLTPGVVAVPGAGAGVKGEFSINGQRTEANYYMVDGVSASTGNTPNDNFASFGSSGSLPSESALGTTQSLVSLDALQEFRIQTSSYSAEFGRTPGGQISFVTRSGTNDWHGSAFDYLRNGALDANNWFNNFRNIPKQSERQNDFGGTLSGPIVLPGYNGHNRTFFFFSYEGLRESTPKAAIITFVPDLAMRQTAPTALQPYLNAFPIPNGPENGTTGMAQFISGYSAPGRLDSTSIRLDHRVDNKSTLFGRFSDSPSETQTRGTSSGPLSNPFTISTSVKALTIGVTTLFSSRSSNEFRFNYSWNNSRRLGALDNLGGAVPFALSKISDFRGNPTPGIDFFEVLLSFGGTSVLELEDLKSNQRQANIVDTLSSSFGKHLIKFGVDYRRLTTPLTFPSLADIAIFTSKTQVQQNLAATGLAQAFQSFPFEPIYTNLSLFVHDEWRATTRLHLSIGLRWEFNPPPGDAHGNPPYVLDQITDLTTSQLAPKGTRLWKTTYNNFAPRLGAAYQLRQVPGREIVVRGGFGVFCDLGNTFASQGYSGFGMGAKSSLPNVPFPLTAAQLTLPPPSVTPPYNNTIVAFDPNLKLPYTLHWNAAIEQALGRSQSVTISYVGAAARRLLWNHLVRPGAIGNQKFTSITNVLTVTNRATSDYDALQAQYQRRLSSGLQALVSYTWSHAIDEASVNSQTTQLLRASSNFDIRHSLQSALTYDLPGKYQNTVAKAALNGWSLDMLVTARSALPFDVLSGTFIDATGTSDQLRADLVPGQTLYLNGPQCLQAPPVGNGAPCPGGRAVNFNAFTAPTPAEKAAGQFGNAPRNLLRAFSAWQMDFAVRREFPIHERLKLEFRAEAFNLFNHPIFGAIQNNLTTGAAAFGQATGTLNDQLGGLNSLYQIGGPRSVQFALRLKF